MQQLKASRLHKGYFRILNLLPPEPLVVFRLQQFRKQKCKYLLLILYSSPQMIGDNVSNNKNGNHSKQN